MCLKMFGQSGCPRGRLAVQFKIFFHIISHPPTFSMWIHVHIVYFFQSIFYTYFFLYKVVKSWCLIQVVSGQRAGYILDRISIYHKATLTAIHTQTPSDDTEAQINQTWFPHYMSVGIIQTPRTNTLMHGENMETSNTAYFSMLYFQNLCPHN